MNNKLPIVKGALYTLKNNQIRGKPNRTAVLYKMNKLCFNWFKRFPSVRQKREL